MPVLRCHALVPVQAIRQFRVDPAHEIRGLDVVKHSEPAYPIGEQRPALQRARALSTVSTVSTVSTMSTVQVPT